MSKEGKQGKHDARHKHHKRKRDEMEPRKLSTQEKNDSKKKVPPYGEYYLSSNMAGKILHNSEGVEIMEKGLKQCFLHDIWINCFK